VVGASVFLLTVAFVAAFLPGTFEPFTADGTEDALVADRTADLLAEQLLAPPTDPGVVEADCAAEFVDAEGDGDDGLSCEFDEDAGDLDAVLGLGSGTGVNVTVEENATVLDAGGERLAAGPTPPDDRSVIVSRRVVLLDGEERDLYVRVW